ncbi:HAD family hydrolase [Spirulina sp. CS-785/01]|uniref:HAD family hydrolase n=1 Tax=Spirulina sp. CS-785/01 TaxID=3021716 RepID=UPI00232F2060|nr:HAD family hydrolase [Spirulina sp. CS-785/01]MDB9314996.1 HAD family hydrolase [Spirulina sp. CS-785/01]
MMATICCGEVTFSEVEAIIFDKDGTLEDSRSFLRELAQKRSRLIDAQIPGIGDPLLMAFGVQEDHLEPAGLMAVGSRWENEVAAAAYIAETGRSWAEAVSIAHESFLEADQYLQRTPETCPLFTGAKTLLQQLTEAGIKLAILSADSPIGVRTFVERHQLSDWIKVTKGVEPGGLGKPDPLLFTETCIALGSQPKNVLMVGDSALDIDMSKQGQVGGAIAVHPYHPPEAAIEGADVAIASLQEIKLQ